MTNASPGFLSAADLVSDVSAPRELVLEPLLASNSIALLYGPAGIGKSFVALGIAWAVASGGSFLGWRAPCPRRVLYVDGEMGAIDLGERLALFGSPPPNLEFWLPDRNPGRALQLDTLDGQLRLMEGWRWPDLVVIDTPSSLTGLAGGDAERSPAFQRFLLWQKQSQRAVLLVRQANRKGAARGTTRSEDALDLVLALRRPADRCVTDGVHVEIHVEKSHRLAGPALVPVLAHLQPEGIGRASWQWRGAGVSRLDCAIPLLREGLDAPALGRALGVSRATAFRLQRRARQRGLLFNPRPPEKAT